MTQEARKQENNDTADTTGMDDLFACHDKDCQEDLTLDEAASRLNLSARTVQRRLKHGQLAGYKIPGPRGPEWRVKIEATDDTTQDTSSATQDKTAASLATTVIDPVSSQDRTDDRFALSHALTEFSEFYKEQIDSLNDKLEAATYRNGYLEAQLSAAEDELKLLPDLSSKAIQVEQLERELAEVRSELLAAKQSWLSRFGKWFLGSR